MEGARWFVPKWRADEELTDKKRRKKGGVEANPCATGVTVKPPANLQERVEESLPDRLCPT